MNRSTFVALFFSFFLCGCVQRAVSIKLDKDLELDSDTGYLLIGIESNVGLENIFISGARSFRLSREDIQQGTNYFLLEMPQGSYSIERIKANQWRYFDLTEGYWDFFVSPGVVSYVGHLNVGLVNARSQISELELENRSSEALAFMEASFPAILENRKIRYHGPGEDRFFEKVESLFNGEDV